MHFFILKNANFHEEHPILHPQPTPLTHHVTTAGPRQNTLGSQVCLWAKLSMEQKDHILARPFRIILMQKCWISTFSLWTWIYLSFMVFCQGPRASGLPQSKNLHWTKRSYFGKAFQSCFMLKCQIPTFDFRLSAHWPGPMQPQQNCINKESTHSPFGQGSL